MMKEKKPNKYYVRKGREWHSKFHKGLGYRICEDDYDLQALALIMKEILKDSRKEVTTKK